jgi:hypothetical protein
MDIFSRDLTRGIMAEAREQNRREEIDRQNLNKPVGELVCPRCEHICPRKRGNEGRRK